MIANNTYPKKKSEKIEEDNNVYAKKGDKLNRFYITGGIDQWFKAEMIEFYGIN
jgi:hypothetical protein